MITSYYLLALGPCLQQYNYLGGTYSGTCYGQNEGVEVQAYQYRVG